MQQRIISFLGGWLDDFDNFDSALPICTATEFDNSPHANREIRQTGALTVEPNSCLTWLLIFLFFYWCDELQCNSQTAASQLSHTTIAVELTVNCQHRLSLCLSRFLASLTKDQIRNVEMPRAMTSPSPTRHSITLEFSSNGSRGILIQTACPCLDSIGYHSMLHPKFR